MWRSRTVLSWRDILNLGLGKYSIAEVTAQEPRCVEIDGSAQDSRQLVLHREKFEAGSVSRLELHDHIHVAVRQKVFAQNRPEERELSNMIAPAEVANALRWNFYLRASHMNVGSRLTRLPAPC